MRGPPETTIPILEEQAEAAIEENIARQEVNSAQEPAVVQSDSQEKPMKADELLETYGWMENEEEYDRQVLDEIMQEEFVEKCFEDMWREEEQSQVAFGPPQRSLPESDAHAESVVTVSNTFRKLMVLVPAPDSELTLQSDLNVDAEEFVPRSGRQS